jgi:hypothetical protein
VGITLMEWMSRWLDEVESQRVNDLREQERRFTPALGEPVLTAEDDALDAEEMARYDAEDAARERREAELSA